MSHIEKISAVRRLKHICIGSGVTFLGLTYWVKLSSTEVQWQQVDYSSLVRHNNYHEIWITSRIKTEKEMDQLRGNKFMKKVNCGR